MTDGPVNHRADMSPNLNSADTAMYIDSQPPPRTTLPPIDPQFDPNGRRGSITDPSMHATGNNDNYRNSNGSTGRMQQAYRSYPSNTGSRPHSIQDERPPSPDLSERRSFDSDSQHGYADRHLSHVSDPHHLPLSRKSSASGLSRVNGNGAAAETASLSGFNSRIARL